MDAETPKRLVDLGGTKSRQDWLSAPGAYALAEEIKKFWRRRGADISVKVQQIHATASPESDNAKIFYCVRSNLRCGLPVGWTAEKLNNND